MPVNNLIQLRKGSSTEWSTQNTVLSSGEPGYSIDNRVLKIGDGSTPWNTLGGLYVDQSSSIITNVFNKTGNTIGKFNVVYINGGQGDQPTIQLAIASGEGTSSKTYGITYEAIGTMGVGRVVVVGALTGVNTDQYNPTAPVGDINGTVLYLSPTVSGGITTTKPFAPNHLVSVGKVIRTHQNEGIVQVSIQNGFELGELHNVSTNSNSDNGKFLQYNSISGLWFPSNTGNFTTLQLNGTAVSVTGHSHTSSDITNFNSSVSGLLPVKSIVAGTGISISSSDGIFTINSISGGGAGGSGTQVSVTGSSALSTINIVGSGGISLIFNSNTNTLTISPPSAVTGYEELTTIKDTFNVSPNYRVGTLSVYYNGFRLINGRDFTATNGSSFILAESGVVGDVVEWVGTN